jgi:6-phosphogluconate dehydrogenase
VRLGLIGSRADLRQAAAAAGLALVDCPPTAGGRTSYAPLAEQLEHPRVVALDEAPGKAIDVVIDDAYLALEPGDLVIDFSSSWWCDTFRRYRRMRHRAIYYLDAVWLHSARMPRLLVAGDEPGLDLARPLLDRLAGAAGLIVAGGPGAAHFTGMVEQAHAAALQELESETRQLLEAYPGTLNAGELGPELAGVSARGGPTAAWLLDDALRLEAAIPLIASALMLRQAAALEAQSSQPPLDRVGPWVDIDEIF